MTRIVGKVVFAWVLAFPAVAAAQNIEAEPPVISRGQGWSLYSGQTVGSGSNVLAAQVGWPGIPLTYLYGAADTFDIGVRLTPLNYGFEGRIRETRIGMKLQAVARLGLVEKSRFNLGLEFAPGPFIYYENRFYRRALAGLSLPLRLAAGIPVGGAIMLNFGMDVPMFVTFGPGGALYLPFLFGGGAEYFINRNLAASFNLKMGPSIYAPTGRAEFAMEALVGIAYKL